MVFTEYRSDATPRMQMRLLSVDCLLLRSPVTLIANLIDLRDVPWHAFSSLISRGKTFLTTDLFGSRDQMFGLGYECYS